MLDSERDYYELLGVPRDADAKTIKDAYHRLAMKWHPDRNPAADAEQHFKGIATAYAVLSDPKKRARYDARGFEGVAHFSPEDLFGGLDLGSVFGDLGFGFGPGGQSIFERFFSHDRAPPVRGRNLRVHLQLPLELIATGGTETLRFARPVECSKCHGYGTKSGSPPPSCPECHGAGHRVVTADTKQNKGGSVVIQRMEACTKCLGKGVLSDKPCRRCSGSGQIDEQETLKVTIPQGIEEGMVLRVPQHGLPGAAGAAPGDLHVVVSSLPDARFQRRGADLWRAQQLDVADAVLGTKVQVATLDSDVEVTIPPGTQPDEVVRMRGKGLPRFHAPGNGDLNLRIQVHIPEKLSTEQRRLYEQLRGGK
ncbi:MAG: J domain-containing protein [Gammaproteobacteria bacterium]|nr:J domain-containing protein [Gammaproteobacteria bacterium]